MQITNETAKDYIEKAEQVKRVYARKYPNSQYNSDELYSFVIDQLMRGRSIRTKSKWLIIDFIRHMESDPRRATRKKIIEKEGIERLKGLYSEMQSSNKINEEPMSTFLKRCEAGFLEHGLIMLHFKYGYTLKELGYIFGVSEPRLCQVMKMAVDSLRPVA